MRTVLLAALCAAGCGRPSAPVEGVYTMCREVEGYAGETLELKDGRFRYWSYSDVLRDDEPDYPLTGTYQVDGDIVVLGHPRIYGPRRAWAVVNGHAVLWRDDGYKGWKKDGSIHPYSVLLRVQATSGDNAEARRPSIQILKSPERLDREKKAYDDRYHDQAAEVRVLLRARSAEDLDEYRAAVAKARVQPDPRLVAQLVRAHGGDSSLRQPALSILQDLYQSTLLFPERPRFLDDPIERRRALEALIDALGSAADRYPLEDVLLIFLRASGTPKMDLSVQDTDIRIVLEVLEANGSRQSSSGPVDDVRWASRMSQLIPACQAWMRNQLK